MQFCVRVTTGVGFPTSNRLIGCSDRSAGCGNALPGHGVRGCRSSKRVVRRHGSRLWAEVRARPGRDSFASRCSASQATQAAAGRPRASAAPSACAVAALITPVGARHRDAAVDLRWVFTAQRHAHVSSRCISSSVLVTGLIHRAQTRECRAIRSSVPWRQCHRRRGTSCPSGRRRPSDLDLRAHRRWPAWPRWRARRRAGGPRGC